MTSATHDEAFASALEDIRNALERGDGDAQGAVDVLFERFEPYSWVGIYVVSADELILGAWRGPQATEHVRIPVGQGICGAAAASGVTEIVDDVNADPRYLSCFSSTRSEIVVPIHRNGQVVGEIDIDSDRPSAFGPDDQAFVERLAALLAPVLGPPESD